MTTKTFCIFLNRSEIKLIIKALGYLGNHWQMLKMKPKTYVEMRELEEDLKLVLKGVL